MEVKSRCIALKTIKFKESKSIVTCLVRGLGKVSFIVSEGAGREAKRRRALTMAGSVFEAVIDYRENRNLQTMRDLSAVRPLIIDSGAKQAVITFVADFVSSILDDAPPDALLFDYVDSHIAHVIATRRSVANAPICFLIGLQQIAGIAPDMSTYREGASFDMNNGIFYIDPFASGHLISPQEAAYMPQLMRINLRNMHLYRFSREQRNRQLDLAIEYFNHHFGRTRQIRSLEILRSLFG